MGASKNPVGKKLPSREKKGNYDYTKGEEREGTSPAGTCNAAENHCVGIRSIWLSRLLSCVVMILSYFFCYGFSCKNGMRSKLLWKRPV